MSQEKVIGLLGPGTSFEGKLSFEGTLRLGGQFKGEIYTPGTVVIDAGAEFEGEIEAQNVLLMGQLKGNIYAKEKVQMKVPAKFVGTVTTPSLSVGEGVVFEGASYMPQENKHNS